MVLLFKLYLEPLHQPFFVMGFCELESYKLFAQGSFKLIFLISSS
jgi:hypothetical protein